ncbi:MAG: non-homologous end-joining DNA ligase [Myxococcales bacterium]|jgi:bifunctional non-homologous end joining protein LigD
MGTRRYGPYSVETSNEDKVLFPDAEITKGDLINYYDRIAERLLPHLRGRPLVMQRFPDGIEDDGFYHKQVSSHFPDWIETARVEVKGTGETQELVVCENRATLAFLANQGCVALHPWLSRADRLEHPDSLIIDLDPAGDDFQAVRRAAFHVRELLQELQLPAYVKLTGSRGVHVLVPLDRSADFDAVRRFARSAMDLLAARHPDSLTTEQRKDGRAGRLYLDVARNAYAQTAVAPWSVRPLPDAPVAAPINWDDLQNTDLGPRDYNVKNVFRRTARRDDPWAGMRSRAHGLQAARERLEKLRNG